MSEKAPGILFNVPKEPVVKYSAEMTSYFEMLHREVWRGKSIPDKIDSIFVLVKQLKSLYYAIREHLESDHGISHSVCEALPEIELKSVLKTLTTWEEDAQKGREEYLKRASTDNISALSNADDFFLGHRDCWNQYRLWIFEANRMLTVCRRRIAVDVPETSPRRYPWILDI